MMTWYHLGAKAHCCCCVAGVLCTLLGIALLSTGVSMIQDYGKFDVSMLPPGWRNSDGQRNLGIILITLGVGSLILGVVVSVLFFTVCNRGQAEPHGTEPEKPPEKQQEPPLPSVVVTVSQPVDSADLTAARRHHHHRHRHKHHGKHSKKSSKHKDAMRLETHLETAEEQDGLHSREHSAGRKRSNSSVSRKSHRHTQPLDPKLLENNDSLPQTERHRSPDANASERDSEGAVGQTSWYLPPLLIAPAAEAFSTCDSVDDSNSGAGEPAVFSVDAPSVTSADSSSLVASTGTSESFQPYYNAKDEMVWLDRQLSDVLK